MSAQTLVRAERLMKIPDPVCTREKAKKKKEAIAYCWHFPTSLRLGKVIVSRRVVLSSNGG
jgi:hypothetical protein